MKGLTDSKFCVSLLIGDECSSNLGTAFNARDIPPGILVGDSVRVDFTLDKAIPAAQADGRELGVIAHRVSLETK